MRDQQDRDINSLLKNCTSRFRSLSRSYSTLQALTRLESMALASSLAPFPPSRVTGPGLGMNRDKSCPMKEGSPRHCLY